MERLSAGRCIILVLSAAYLRFEYCMYELYRIWQRADRQDTTFLGRIVPLVLGDAQIDQPRRRIAHAAHWQGKHTAIQALIGEHGTGVIGVEDFKKFKLLEEFSRHVGDMLALIADRCVPRDLETLARDRFAAVRELVDKALR